MSDTAVPPDVTISAPAVMIPPVTIPALTMAPGSPVTFSGTATDDEGLHDVTVTLQNSATGERLASDGTWGTNVSSGNYRISPIDIGGTSYNWSYTTPFNLTPGSYSFTVRATDNDGLTTASGNQGRLSFTAQIAGDNPPDTTLTNGPVSPFTITDPNVSITGTAVDDFGVASVQLTVVNNETGRYLQDNGTYASTYNTVLASQGTPKKKKKGKK